MHLHLPAWCPGAIPAIPLWAAPLDTSSRSIKLCLRFERTADDQGVLLPKALATRAARENPHRALLTAGEGVYDGVLSGSWSITMTLVGLLQLTSGALGPLRSRHSHRSASWPSPALPREAEVGPVGVAARRSGSLRCTPEYFAGPFRRISPCPAVFCRSQRYPIPRRAGLTAVRELPPAPCFRLRRPCTDYHMLHDVLRNLPDATALRSVPRSSATFPFPLSGTVVFPLSGVPGDAYTSPNPMCQRPEHRSACRRPPLPCSG